jgi:hypothetical protein
MTPSDVHEGRMCNRAVRQNEVRCNDHDGILNSSLIATMRINFERTTETSQRRQKFRALPHWLFDWFFSSHSAGNCSHQPNAERRSLFSIVVDVLSAAQSRATTCRAATAFAERRATSPVHRIELDLSLCLAQARLSRISETATEGLASFDRIQKSKSPNCVAVRGSSQFLQSGKLFGPSGRSAGWGL